MLKRLLLLEELLSDKYAYYYKHRWTRSKNQFLIVMCYAFLGIASFLAGNTLSARAQHDFCRPALWWSSTLIWWYIFSTRGVLEN